MKNKHVDFLLGEILVAIVGLQETVKDLTRADELPHDDEASSERQKPESKDGGVSFPPPSSSGDSTSGEFTFGDHVWIEDHDNKFHLGRILERAKRA